VALWRPAKPFKKCGNKKLRLNPGVEGNGSHGRLEAGINEGKVQDWCKQCLTKCKLAQGKQH